MRVKLFTLRYSSTLGGFDETPLCEFAREKELLSFREHFFSVNEVPHLACVLEWQDTVVSGEDQEAAREIPPRATSTSNGAKGNSRRGVDPTATLDEPERVLFNTLREWRSKKANEEGVPPYLVFTNRHLVEIVRRRPESPTALGNLTGIGPGKVRRYGADILRALHGKKAGKKPEAAS